MCFLLYFYKSSHLVSKNVFLNSHFMCCLVKVVISFIFQIFFLKLEVVMSHKRPSGRDIKYHETSLSEIYDLLEVEPHGAYCHQLVSLIQLFF